MNKLLLLPVENAQRLGITLPGPTSDWVQTHCPTCPRPCWVTVEGLRRITAGEVTAVCYLCEQHDALSESFRRMLRGEGGKQMMPIEEARKKFPPMWTIYRAPRDMPGVAFASRVFFGETITDEVMTAGTLTEIRDKVRAAGGFACLGRSLHDDPCIVETWV